MTGFPNSALALAVLLAGAGAALAQVPDPSSGELTPAAPAATAPAPARDPNAPIRLGPRRIITPADTLTPATPAAVPAGKPPAGNAGGAGPVIKLQTLGTVDADSVGTLDDAQGGLGVDMWHGTGRAYVGRLLALLPRRVASPAMRDLRRRLLLTRAVAPASQTHEPNLFGRRIAVLVAAGDQADTRDLIQLAPSGATDEKLQRTLVEGWFYTYDTAAACRIVRAEAQDRQADYWLQASAFCLALSGKTAEASLVSDILREREEKISPVFFAAMDAIAGEKPPKIKKLETPTGLQLAMLRAARMPVPLETLAGASPAALAAIATHPKTPVDQRLAAAEAAARLGALSGRALFGIYGDVGITVDKLDTALTRAAADWGPRSRALLVRAAARYDVPAARAEVLQQAFKLGREKGGFPAVALAAGPLLRGMKPADELRWFAPMAARALLETDQRDAAAGWIALALAGGRSGTPDGDLWPLAALTRDPENAVTPQAVAEWWYRQDRTAQGVLVRARVLFALLEAEGMALPGSLWADVLDEPRRDGQSVPTVALRHALARAAADGRRGETVALALLALGETGPGPDNLPAVQLAVDALRKVGLAVDAKRLVIETALAAGL